MDISSWIGALGKKNPKKESGKERFMREVRA